MKRHHSFTLALSLAVLAGPPGASAAEVIR